MTEQVLCPDFSSEPQFRVGDSVYLKCGSCRMSVYYVDEKHCYCVWQNFETKAIMRDQFIHAVLRKHT